MSMDWQAATSFAVEARYTDGQPPLGPVLFAQRFATEIDATDFLYALMRADVRRSMLCRVVPTTDPVTVVYNSNGQLEVMCRDPV